MKPNRSSLKWRTGRNENHTHEQQATRLELQAVSAVRSADIEKGPEEEVAYGLSPRLWMPAGRLEKEVKNWRNRPDLIPARPQVPQPLEWFKCNHCGTKVDNLKELADHKRGHNTVPYPEDVNSLPSSMGGGWNP